MERVRVPEWHETLPCLDHLLCGRHVPEEEDEVLASHPLLPVLSFLSFLDQRKNPCFEVPEPALAALRTGMDVQPDGSTRINEKHAMQVFEEPQPLLLFFPPNNAAIHFLPQPGGKSVSVSAYCMQALTEEVLAHTKILRNFPSLRVCADASLLRLESFTGQLCGLASFTPDDAMPKSVKGGQQYDEVRETPKPTHVLSWLLPVLASASTPEGEDMRIEFNQITKSIIDEVSFKNALKPWRRSGVWTALKAFLHVSFVEALGAEKGALAYKTLILEYHLFVLSHLRTTLVQKHHSLAHEFLAKLATRFAKLHALSSKHPHFPIELESLSRKMKQAQEALHASWTELAARPVTLPMPPSQALPTNPDVHAEFAQLLNRHLSSAPAAVGSQSYTPTRADVIPFDKFSKEYDFEERVWEAVLSESADPASIIGIPIGEFPRALRDHFGTSSASGPITHSRKVLACFALFMFIDKAVCKNSANCGVPLEYSPGLHLGVFQRLLLPSERLLRVCQCVETYFRKRDEGKGANKLIHSLQMCVDIGARSAAVQRVRDRILAKEEEKVKEKMEEVKGLRVQRDAFEAKIQRTSHERDGFSESCVYDCKACELESKIKSFTVLPFCRWLPSDANERLAIACELSLDPLTREWRNLAFFLNVTVLQVEAPESKVQHHGTWAAYFETEPRKGACGPIFIFPPFVGGGVTISTTNEYMEKSHYSRQTLSIDSPLETYILNNGGNAKTFFNSVAVEDYDARSKRFRVSGFRFALTGAYRSLQGAMESHFNQNVAIAQQNLCPKELSLTEYISFGGLRAGPDVLYHQLKHMLVHDSLSWSNENVAMLVLQAVLQADVSSLSWLRCAHEALQDPGLCESLLESLQALFEKQRENWESPWSMMIIIVTLSRMIQALCALNPNGAVVKRCLALLRSCRQNCLGNWTDKVTRILDELLQSAAGSSDQHVSGLQRSLFVIALCGALTFLPLSEKEREGEGSFKPSQDDCLAWLKLMQALYDNTPVSIKHPFTEELFRVVRTLSFDMAPQLYRALTAGGADEFSSPLTAFVTPFLSRAASFHQESVTGSWKPAVQDSVWWRARTTHGRVFEVNILSGSILTDGQEATRLPDAITGSSLFRRCFATKVFRVRPSGAGTYETFQSASAHRFAFSCIGGRLTIRMIPRNTENMLELVPHDLLEKAGSFPRHFPSNFSHWFSRDESRVYLLPREFADADSFDLAKSAYIFDCNKEKLCDQRDSRRTLLSAKHALVRYWHKIMRQLDDEPHVHIWKVGAEGPDSFPQLGQVSSPQDLPKGLVEIVLYRCGFSFRTSLASPRDIFSKQHLDKRVSPDQYVGTLINLDRGLVLEDSSEILHSRSLLLPRMEVSRSMPEGEKHQRCSLSEEGPDASVKILEFEMESHLRRLIAPPAVSAWLYLALLHASTSHPCADPWTGMTGMETALHILQSPRARSCEPYDDFAQRMLTAIANLSPSRAYYPAHLKRMQTVGWDGGMHAWVAHDAYEVIYRHLLADNERLNTFFEQLKPSSREEGDHHLSARAYLRHKRQLGPMAWLSPAIEMTFTSTLPSPRGSSNDVLGVFDPCHDSMFIARKYVRGERLDTTPASSNPSGHQLFERLGQHISPATKVSSHMIGSWVNGKSKLECSTSFMTVAQHVISRKGWQESLFVLAGLKLAVESSTQSDILNVLMAMAHRRPAICIPQSPITGSSQPDDKRTFAEVESAITNSRSEFAEREPHRSRRQTSAAFQEMLSAFRMRRDQYRSLQTSECERLLKSAQDHLRSLHPVLDSVDPRRKDIPFPEYAQLQGSNPSYHSWNTFTAINDVLRMLFHSSIVLKVLTCICEEAAMQCWRPNTATGLVIRHPVSHSEPLQWRIPPSADPGAFAAIPRSETLLRPKFLEQPLSSPDRVEKGAHQLTQEERSLLFTESDRLSKALNRSLMESLRAPPPQEAHGHIPFRIAFEVQLHTSHLKQHAKSVEEDILGVVQGGSAAAEILDLAGLRVRVTPLTLCEQVLAFQEGQEHFLLGSDGNETLIYLLRVWVLEQKLERVLRFMLAENDFLLRRELANPLHRSWDPHANPAWLLFELESNMGIRDVQVRVAQRMIQPEGEGTSHSVMQLNMGEGKSTLILPLVAHKLADGERLVRVIVPEPLLRITAEGLSARLGGLLRRRVYVLPCRRDLDFSQSAVNNLSIVLKQAREERSIVVCTPEHVLSLQLKTLEACRVGGATSPSADLRAILSEHVLKTRDILDESDEVLHVKRQLVYTMGQRQAPHPGPLRWTVIAAVLELLMSRSEELVKLLGDDVLEVMDAGSMSVPRLKDNEKSLPAFRIMAAIVLHAVFTGEIAECSEALRLQPLLESEQNKVARFVLSPVLESEDVISSFMNISMRDDERHVYVLLRGLLAYDVLYLALSKRWRVEYGVDKEGRRRMAVPFRAKDRASKTTEFGHVDVALALTYLSYYNGGLDDSMLACVFETLRRMEDPESIYSSWIDFARKGGLMVDASLAQLSGIAFSDVSQMQRVFEVLRFNQRVINFHLTHHVFQHEAKQFPQKIVATPWSFVPQQRGELLTGFSGTNDTQWILPVNIKQADLPELQYTNAHVLRAILREENRVCEEFPSPRSLESLTKILVGKEFTCKGGSGSQRIQVLIDVGALLLEDNELIARGWLASRPDMEAVVFFHRDRLVVAARDNGEMQPLSVSPYERNLSKCLVYLDEEHTRGTDLRLPGGTLAAVTLGPRLTRDKFVQACMRMRQLGQPNGHRLVFLASTEVYRQLQSLGQGGADQSAFRQQVTSFTALRWVLGNTRKALEMYVLHWMQQGVNSSVHEENLFAGLVQDDAGRVDWGGILQRTCDRDGEKLQESYARCRQKLSLVKICDMLLRRFESGKVPSRSLSQQSRGHAHSQIPGCLRACIAKYFADCDDRFHNLLDEEQEREMEREKEVELQVERPPGCKPVGVVISQALKALVAHGSTETSTSGDGDVLRLRDMFWQWFEFCKGESAMCDVWGQEVYATRPYIHSVFFESLPTQAMMDEYLRPVMWVLLVKSTSAGPTRSVILAPFEAQYVARAWKTSQLAPGLELRLFVPQQRLDANNVFRDARLVIRGAWKPSWVETPEALAREASPLLDISLSALVDVHVFSGSLFFESALLQNAVLAKLGLCCRPHSAEEMAAFESGLIKKDGFVAPEHRILRATTEESRSIECGLLSSVVPLLQAFLDGPCKLHHVVGGSHMGKMLWQTVASDVAGEGVSAIHRKILSVRRVPSAGAAILEKGAEDGDQAPKRNKKRGEDVQNMQMDALYEMYGVRGTLDQLLGCMTAERVRLLRVLFRVGEE